MGACGVDSVRDLGRYQGLSELGFVESLWEKNGRGNRISIARAIRLLDPLRFGTRSIAFAIRMEQVGGD